jgi:RNA polymerase sigma factor (sigma-70 family)
VSEKSPASKSSLSDFLAQLPEEERFILTLHYIHGRSADEIASALGVPPKPVESLIASGRAKILAVITNI